jgi:hypothetical protein
MRQRITHTSSGKVPLNKFRLALYRSFALTLGVLFLMLSWSARVPGQEPSITYTALPAPFPLPWLCSPPAPSPQTLLNFHRNWHCSNPDNSPLVNWGNRFLGFHKQYILDFDLWRVAQSPALDRIETWQPGPSAVIPDAHTCENGVTRPADTAAPTTALPSNFRVAAVGGTLDSYANANDIGNDIVGWHNGVHNSINSVAGCNDMGSTQRAPRDPIFWKFHNMLDDVHKTWQELQAADVMIVLDRSGSMSLPSGTGTDKMTAAKSAASLFADLIEDGKNHRLGMVSFSTDAASPIELNLTSANGATINPAIMSALSTINASGSTSIGDGLDAARVQLATGTNPHKAILVITDGMENVPATIASVQPALGPATQVNAIGYGESWYLDGPKLIGLTEKQGGIYIAGPSELELKKFFVTAFGDIFDAFMGEDPIEKLAAGDAVSKAINVGSCGDQELTFVLAWDKAVPKGDLRLIITSPDGTPVSLSDQAIESSFGPTWHFVRIPLPYRGSPSGQWKAQAVRPFRFFVNGFATDAFVKEAEGTALVRDQIQRLCPDGCKNVLLFDDSARGAGEGGHGAASAYKSAVIAEQTRTKRLGAVTFTSDPAEFARLLRGGRWELIVYANQYSPGAQPFDQLLTGQLCATEPRGQRGTRAIITDTRGDRNAAAIFRCAGARRDEGRNWKAILGDDLLVPQDIRLQAPPAHDGGHATHDYTFSYSVAPLAQQGTLVSRNDIKSGAVVGVGAAGVEQNYFITSLVKGQARVDAFDLRFHHYTGEPLKPVFRIRESYWPVDGYDSVEAKVTIERPLTSVGRLGAEVGVSQRPEPLKGDQVDPRVAALLRYAAGRREPLIRTAIETYPLNDNGRDGDNYANDHYYSVSLPGIAKVDGQYRLHAVFTFKKGGCTFQREAESSIYVEAGIDQEGTKVERGKTTRAQDGRYTEQVRFIPRDAFGNPVGPGRRSAFELSTIGDVKVQGELREDGKGGYEVTVSWTDRQGKPQLLIRQPTRKDVTIPLG